MMLRLMREREKTSAKRPRGTLVRFLLLGLIGSAGCQDGHPTLVDETHYLATDLGFDVGRLFNALDLAEASGSVQGLVVERHGVVAAETYAPDVSPWSLFETWTVTASVTSLLVGKALETGDLESLDQTLGELLVPWSQLLDEEKAGITLRQLLTMTSGVSRPTGTPEEYLEWLAMDDQVAWVLGLPLRSVPGEKYTLDSGAAHLLSAALTQATGKSLVDLAQIHIMGPMDIPWVDWMVDAKGINFGGFGLRIRTRDMVKFARLVLGEGRWNGTEVVSPSWIQESTTPHLHPYPEAPEWGFGYLWKSSTCSGHPCIYANGYGGQILVAVPDLDLAIAVNSAYSEDQEAAAASADTAWGIVGQIIPSAR